MSSYAYQSDFLLALERVLSSDRFETYLALANYNRQEALGLYKQNIRSSEKLYTILHILEVCLRNRIDEILSQEFGSEWYYGHLIEFLATQKLLIKEVTAKNKGGRLIAHLPFGFWTAFFSRAYDGLWRHKLRFIFDKKGPLTRSEIARILKDLRILRNRVAHHESILKLDLEKLEKEAFTLIEWLSESALLWLREDLLKY